MAPSTLRTDRPQSPASAQEGRKSHVFVSFSSRDSATVSVEIARLSAAGFRVWYDETGEADAGNSARIKEALEGCALFVVFLTPRTVESGRVRDELRRALELGKPVLAVHLLETNLRDLAATLRAVPALHKYRLSLDRYHRKLLAAMPAEAHDPQGLTPIPAPTPERPPLPTLDAASDYLILPRPDGSFRAWELTAPYCTIGRADARVVLPGKEVSRRHAVLARLGPRWVALNASRKNVLTVDGRVVRQQTLHDGAVLRIGDHRLVFLSGTALARRPDLTPMPGRRSAASPSDDTATGHAALAADVDAGRVDAAAPPSVDDTDEAAPLVIPDGETGVPGAKSAGSKGTTYLRLGGGTSPIVSDSADHPILIGSHPRCPFVLPGEGVAPFHCLLAWLPKGPCLFDLDGGKTLLGGEPVRSALVRNGQRIQLGSRTLTVELAGDPTAPASRRVPKEPRGLWLTVMQGPHKGETAELPADRAVLLGKAASSDLLLERDARVARRQLALQVKPGPDPAFPFLVLMRDVSNRDSAFVNSLRVGNLTGARPGDVIHFSDDANKVTGTALVLHYDLRESSAW
jgi:pSer/pThr/pTyr-binding forkhead associated (FHA) protein